MFLFLCLFIYFKIALNKFRMIPVPLKKKMCQVVFCTDIFEFCFVNSSLKKDLSWIVIREGK